MSLASFQVKHADERPSLCHVRQPHSRHGKHWVPRPAVIALDQDPQEYHLVFLELPLQRLVPHRLCHWWVVAFVQQTSDTMVLFVRRGLPLWRLAAEVVRVDECAGDVWLHLVGGIVFWGGDVGGTAYVKAKPLLASSAKLSVAACTEGGRFQNVAVGAREQCLGDC